VPTLEFLWDTFGPDRLIFGTNWPVSGRRPVRDSIDLRSYHGKLPDRAVLGGRDRIMYKNALRFIVPAKRYPP
jgi:predicted TIM-barrel fold metal-dependent hydrolase